MSRSKTIPALLSESSVLATKRLAKAEAWLSKIANHIEGVWDQEALVYLKSRGRDCDAQVLALTDSWSADQEETLHDYNKRAGRRRATEGSAPNINDNSSILLKDFWRGAPPGDYSFEAAMLRTVEWCEISGFEQWWRRLARRRKENLLRGGMEEPVHAAYWLFNIVRSEYAITLMRPVLEGYLDSISLTEPTKRWPWEFDNQEQHLAYASAIIFAHHRLNSDKPEPELVHQAVEMICREQDSNGAWRVLTSDADVSVESTAMAMHALALAQPPGWRRIVARAIERLWSAQKADGSWIEPGCAGPVHLTVLVLDAIALADGEKIVTFRSPSMSKETVAAEAMGNAETGPSPAIVTSTAIRDSKPLFGAAEVVQANSALPELRTKAERRAAVNAYIEEVFQRTGKRITRKQIWQAARYKSRTDFELWQRNHPKATKTAHNRFMRLLFIDKPHLK